MLFRHWQGVLLLFVFCSAAVATSPLPEDSLSLKGVLGQQNGLTTGFHQVLNPRVFAFPEDHLAHQAYKTEWWYFTGNLSTAQAQKFAYQFTLFRFALHPHKVSAHNSAWRSNNIYMAHVALTDIKQKKMLQQERFSRDGLALAGVGKTEQGLVQFWLNDWQISALQPERLFPLALDIQADDFALKLQLDTVKPLVLQGDQGLSQKNNSYASYYYSYSRLASKGTISIGSSNYEVVGDSWFDREWSTSALAEDQQGWDWFSLHLDDGSELMLYQMRKKNGVKDSYSSAVLIDAQGNSETLQAQQFQLAIKKFWQSPVSGIRYPINWAILIPEKNIQLLLSTPVKQQEWSKAGGFSFNYWEGSVFVNGIKNHQPVTGSGYLEMTGYD